MLDLRIPIGYFFLINGLLLVIDGLVQPNSTLYAGFTLNLDVVWGAVLLVFGLFTTALAYLTRGKPTDSTGDSGASSSD